MRTFGVDVSHWEGRINWQVASPAIGFAYYKCTDGTRGIDAQFSNNQSGCSEVTMYGYSTEGETKKCDLEPDDIAGLVTLYPLN